MRSFNFLRKTVTRGDARDTVKLTVDNIRISAPQIPPAVPAIVVTPPREPSAWDPRDARPKCAFSFFIRGADDYSETYKRLQSRRAWRGRPIGLRNLPPPPVRSTETPSTKKSTKRHAVGNFAQVVARAADPAEDSVRYGEVMRREIWGGVKISLPADGVFTVVVPRSSTSRKAFKFGKGMQCEEMYGRLVTYLSDETDRESPAPMVFVSRSYPDAIYDAESYKAWLTWMKERDARDRVLLAV